MANPDIPAAILVLHSHLVLAGAALTDGMVDVARGLPTGGRQIRYYWGGEVDPPRFDFKLDMNGEIVGQRFILAALWPLTYLAPEVVAVIDAEMQTLAGEIRTRINGDSQLGGNVSDLELGYAEPDIVTIANARHIALTWQLDLSYVEYGIAA